jgi:Putative addiction module component
LRWSKHARAEHELAFASTAMHIQTMNERAKIITEQALALPRDEQEELYRALAASLGKPDAAADEAWLDEAEDRLAAYDRGEIGSVTLIPNRETIDAIREARSGKAESFGSLEELFADLNADDRENEAVQEGLQTASRR